MQQNNKVLLVMLHGFLGSDKTFETHQDHFNTYGIDVLTFNLPGHGDNWPLDALWDFDYVATYVMDQINNMKEKYAKVVLFGYSMGGRIALYIATHYPNIVDGLIIENATPGIQNNEERSNRHLLDIKRGEAINEDYEGFVNHWAKLPLFQTVKPLSRDVFNRLQSIRLSHHPEGLKKALTDYGTGNQPNLWPLLQNINMPVLLLSGKKDQKFTEITKAMHQSMPNSKHIECDAGHTIHVEDSIFFDTIIVSFIKEEIM